MGSRWGVAVVRAPLGSSGVDSRQALVIISEALFPASKGKLCFCLLCPHRELPRPYVPLCWQPRATAFVCGIESPWLRPADDAEGSLGKHGLDPDHPSEAQAPEMAGESGFSSWSGR